MKPIHASRQLVINCITTSLLLLMEQKEYNKITIVDITKKAGVSRMAFYRNFETKDDILLQHFDNIIEPFKEKIDLSALTDFKELLTNFLHVLKENESFFESLIKSQLLDLCWERYIVNMKKSLKEYLSDDNLSLTGEYLYHFFTGGLVNVMKAYSYNGANLSSEALVNLLNDILLQLIQLRPKLEIT